MVEKSTLFRCALKRFCSREYILSVLFVFAYLCFRMPLTLSDNNSTYILEHIHTYNPVLLAGNVAIADTIWSPRLFLNFLFGNLMKLSGGVWSVVAVPFLYFGCLIFAWAIVEIVFNTVKGNHFFYVFILTYLLTHTISTRLNVWGVFSIGDIGLSMSWAIAVLSIAQVLGERKRWALSWFLMALAAMVHVHEGLWGGFYLCLLLILSFWQTKKIQIGKSNIVTFAFFILVMGVYIIPGVFTSSGSLSGSEFVDIYARYRTPHHLIISSWSVVDLFRFFLILVILALVRYLCLRQTQPRHKDAFCLEALVLLLAWLGIAVSMYVFTEIIPISFLVTMFLPKFFKYLILSGVLWVFFSIRDYFDNGDVFSAVTAMMVLLLLSASDLLYIALIGATLLLIKVCALYKKSVNGFSVPISFVELISFLALCAVTNRWLTFICVLVIAWAMLLHCATDVDKSWDSWRTTIALFCAGMAAVLYSTYGKVWTIRDRSVVAVSPEQYIVSGADAVDSFEAGDIYELAVLFRSTTYADAQFLSDPNANVSWWFQMIAMRNNYVNWKNVPGDKGKLADWYARMLETAKLFDKSNSEIATIMTDRRVDYILVPRARFAKFDSDDKFAVFQRAPHDSLRVYKLDEGSND